jgi:hypothetical protein
MIEVGLPAWLLASSACLSQSANNLVARATFDLGCPKDQLHWFRLNETGTVWGADGCGHRATYIYNQQTEQWIMNARGDDDPAASAPGVQGPTPITNDHAQKEANP